MFSQKIPTLPSWYQKQVSRTGTSNYILQILWDAITCPCHWYLLLAQQSLIVSGTKKIHSHIDLHIVFACHCILKYVDRSWSHQKSKGIKQIISSNSTMFAWQVQLNLYDATSYCNLLCNVDVPTVSIACMMSNAIYCFFLFDNSTLVICSSQLINAK